MGLARFSPRLNLLKRFAGSENPILSISAMYLIRDRTARRIGGSVEFIFIVVLPFICIALALATISTNTHYPERFHNSDFMEIASIALFWFGRFTRFLGYLYGFMLLILPGVAITKRETDGSVLRMLPLDRKEVYTGMLKLNLASFFMPAAIFYLFELGLTVLVRVILEHAVGDIGYGSLTSYGSLFFLTLVPLDSQIVLVAWVLVFLLYVSVYSIHPSFRYRVAWSSFMALMGGILLLALILFSGTIWLSGLFSGSPSDSIAGLLLVAAVLILLFFAIAADLAQGAIADRINPVR